MCGIAGIMTRDGRTPDLGILDRFETALRHRGPDGQGRHVSGNLAMVQTRLAIIDLETGNQPLYEPGGAALIANGEIYNYVELRQDMPETQFKTRSDCEPPLHLYRREGHGFVRRLRGMYAIAIHDSAENALLLTRDPFGIKPFYYVERADFFAFASEPRALIAAGLVEPELESERRNELLQLQFTCGRGTIFKGVRRILPGETIIVRNARIVERHRISSLPYQGPSPMSTEDALTQLHEALADSILVHQRSDVPYGLFLSGGSDSAVILAMMARLNARPVLTYTVGFSNAAVADERAHARAVARAVGAQHIEIEFSETDFWNLLPGIAAAVDDPAADYAILPTWKLAQIAARDLKVVLSGEGGDEMFAGYGRYRSLLRPWWLGGRGPRSRGIFDGLGVLRDEDASWRDAVTATEATVSEAGRTRLQVAQAVDCADWLANDLLIKLDRCLMAHGLEGRTPFLDPVIANLAFTLPDNLKIRQGHGKWLLRAWLDRALPEAKAFERKRGFTVPIGEWIHRRGERIGSMVARCAAIEAVADPDAVRRLFTTKGRRTGFAAWVLLFYALWHRYHIERIPAEGDIADVLAAR